MNVARLCPKGTIVYRADWYNEWGRMNVGILGAHESICIAFFGLKREASTSKQLVKKVRLARLERVISHKQSAVIAKKRVPRKLKVKYLGSWIAHDGSSTEEVRYRIARARKKFNSLFTLWKMEFHYYY